MTALIAVGAVAALLLVVVVLQARRIARLGAKVRDQAEMLAVLRGELGYCNTFLDKTLAANDRLAKRLLGEAS